MSMLVQTLYLLADPHWAGHLGKEAIAAVGVAGNIPMIVLALIQMLGVGTTTLIAQAAGRKDQVRAELVFNQSFVMSIVIAFALGIVGFLLRPAYCDWLSAYATTATLAKAYLLWFLPGLLLQFPPRGSGLGTARHRDHQAGCRIPGAERAAQYRACSIADRHSVADDAGPYIDRVPRPGDTDSHLLARSASDCFWQRVSSDRVSEFRVGGNCLCNFQRFSGNRQHATTAV